MADELGPGDMHDLWRNQPSEPVRLSADDLRREAHKLEVNVQRAYRMIALIMIPPAAGFASLLYFFPHPIHRIGASLTLAAYLYCGCQLYKRGAFRKAPSGAASATGASYRALLERQRDFIRDGWKKFMLPFIPGPALFLLGSWLPEFGVVKGLGLTAAVILSPFVCFAAVRLMRLRVLQRQIDELDAMMRQP
jgi:hypothetical protein